MAGECGRIRVDDERTFLLIIYKSYEERQIMGRRRILNYNLN